MNEWIHGLFESNEGEMASGLSLAIRFICSTLLGWTVAEVYRLTKHRSQNHYDRSMYVTLVLLTVLICMVTTVVGNSVARAFSLAGALAIVRFRTVVEDTRDTAFVIFAVVVGMAIGCSQWNVPLIGIPIVSLAAVGLHMPWWAKPGMRGRGGRTSERYRIRLRLGLGIELRGVIQDAIDQAVTSQRIVEITTIKQGAAIEILYDVEWSDLVDPLDWVNRINRLQGVQSVALERPDAVDSTS
ncbi:hypothetical protein VN12_22295 [Pirellula sp. SH-Sr6A]|uniref:DUF4956 domain-containing protein n=1 Tax=Pirellula sp. SH-Sr6A TaxID=1632865 RepID=UPI00078DEFA6|nr:DUF4956 domain-containing protein [Pirellula sp. SH-Sr6A]AMV34874.1 hypothetical protein VN12_22295 [Pirellula sp. SH-Sr6A]